MNDQDPTANIEVGPNYQHPLYDLDKDLPFSQPVTFAHLPWRRCLAQSSHRSEAPPLDIAVLGFPYDTSTSYRPGARFGPRGIRAASSREKAGRSFNVPFGIDPFSMSGSDGTGKGLEVVDCGDIPISPFDTGLARRQMEQGYRQVLYGQKTSEQGHALGWDHPRILSLGGDHSIVLPILRALKETYGPLSVIHLDSHLDTWDPYASGYGGILSEESAVTHGTFFWHASREGCIAKNASVHGGLRTKLFSLDDYRVDKEDVGFRLIEAAEVDEPAGMDGIIRRVRDVVGLTNPVYLSIDIDVLDPSIAPATGTPESGGWTTREVKRFIRGLQGVRLVGADVVEVSPPYDTNAEVTSIAATDLLIDILAVMVKDDRSPKDPVVATESLKDEL